MPPSPPALPSALPQNRALVVWLLGACLLIWLMIMMGGATRLTHAGLSIVEWRPLTGIIPPLNQDQWLEAFEHYKQFPEYKLMNRGMELPSFQFIYWMEYTHRLLGRLTGAWFFIPLAVFWKKNRLSAKLKRRMLVVLVLGLLQGLMGWYMVKSGLVKDPNVSHYRLTAHLALAIALYGILFWTVLEVINPFSSNAAGKPSMAEPPLVNRLSLLSCIAIMCTILYGGLVAGLKAGLVYNDFPLMGGQFIPSEWNFYPPLWLNFLENPALVQWIHRWLAATTVALALLTAWKTWRHSPNPQTRTTAALFAAAALIQATLGIFTLLLHVPVILGTLHQGVAILVLSFGLCLFFLGKHRDFWPPT